MPDLESRFDALEYRVDGLEPRVTKIEGAISVLKVDIAEVKTKLQYLATAGDVAESREQVAAKIDSAVNGLLRDALAAEPGYRVMWWTAIGAIAMVVATAISMIGALHR